MEIVSVANRSRASGQRIADAYGLPEVYDSWVDLIEADDTDAICIGTWPYVHRDMVLATLENEKHVMTEAADVHGRCAGTRRCWTHRGWLRTWWRRSCRLR